MRTVPNATSRVDVVRIPDGDPVDVVAVEEPLEIRIDGVPVAVTMRTPGHDEELALGFALSEGCGRSARALPADLAANTVELEAPGFDAARLQRSFYTTSSCGVCGKGALEAIAVEAPQVESALRVSAALLPALPERLRAARRRSRRPAACTRPGCSTRDGALLCVREDVGRHNAMDKVIGWAFRAGLLPLAERSCASAAGSRSSSCRRLPSPAARARRGRCAVVASRSRSPPTGRDALRIRARRPPERLHRAVAHRA